MATENLKNMSKEQKILSVAKYIIENKATISQTAIHFGMSTSSIKKYINDEQNLQSIDNNIYLAVKNVQDEILKDAQIKGGSTGKRSTSISEFEALEIARVMIEKGWTLEQASIYFDEIPTSTIYENLMRITDVELLTELQNLFHENNKMKGGRR